jgi:hypothetical protein
VCNVLTGLSVVPSGHSAQLRGHWASWACVKSGHRRSRTSFDERPLPDGTVGIGLTDMGARLPDDAARGAAPAGCDCGWTEPA